MTSYTAWNIHPSYNHLFIIQPSIHFQNLLNPYQGPRVAGAYPTYCRVKEGLLSITGTYNHSYLWSVFLDWRRKLENKRVKANIFPVKWGLHHTTAATRDVMNTQHWMKRADTWRWLETTWLVSISPRRETKIQSFSGTRKQTQMTANVSIWYS